MATAYRLIGTTVEPTKVFDSKDRRTWKLHGTNYNANAYAHHALCNVNVDPWRDSAVSKGRSEPVLHVRSVIPTHYKIGRNRSVVDI